MSRPRTAALIGAAIVLAALALILAVGPHDPATLRDIAVGFGIFGAAMILRTIGASSGS